MTEWIEVTGVTGVTEVTEERGGADGVTEWREVTGVTEVTEGKRGTESTHLVMIERQGASVEEGGGGNLVMGKKDG